MAPCSPQRRLLPAALAALAVLLLGPQSVAAGKIYCGCTLVEVQECESWGAAPVCELAYFTVGDLPPEGVRSIRWFQDDSMSVPFASNAGNNQRTVKPYYSMGVKKDGRTPILVNITQLRRSSADSPGYKFISATGIKLDGGTFSMKAKVHYKKGLVRERPNCMNIDPELAPPECMASGSRREEPPPACTARVPGRLPPCTIRDRVATWTPSSLEALNRRLESMCPGTTLNIPQAVSFAPFGDSTLTIVRENITVNAPQGLDISLNPATPGACGVQVLAPMVVLNGLRLSGKGGMCICGTANRGVRLQNVQLSGPQASLQIDRGASLASITELTCTGMEVFCVVNLGLIGALSNSRFTAGAKAGALVNFGSIGSLSDTTFVNLNGASGGTCVAAAAVVINTVGATIGVVSKCAWRRIIAGRGLWNDGTIITGVLNCTFNDLSSGAIANGPSGVMGSIFGNTMTGLGTSEGGAGVLNNGLIRGRIESNTFRNAISGNSGGVIAVTSDVGDLGVCGAIAGHAKIEIGIMNNVFETYSSGDACGAVFIDEGTEVGTDFDQVWDSINNPNWQPPKRAALSGIVGNTFRHGISSDNGAGLCARGKVSIIMGNSFFNLTTADSGGGIEVSSSVAFIGDNTMNQMHITDLGGGIFCGVAGFKADGAGKLASVKLIRQNTILNVPATLEGGCMYFKETCGVQFLVGNRCTTQAVAGATANPPYWFAAPERAPGTPALPPVPGDNAATVCFTAGNSVNGAVRNFGSQGAATPTRCPVRATGLWYPMPKGKKVKRKQLK